MSDRPSAGSIWRRWDPHVHLPGTLQNDQFGSKTAAEALNALAACTPRIEAVGVTDYFTTASFRRALAAWTGGAGAGITYLFPNVEMRLDVPTTRGRGINLHVMCDGEDVDGLDRMLASLTFTYRDRDYRADRVGLVALGRAYRNDAALAEEAALREGANQFKVNFDELRTLFQRDMWYREHCLVGVAGGGTDGTSGLQTADGAFAARRQSIERFSNLIFSSHESQRDYWLGKGTDSPSRIMEKYNGLKPCLHGSDAHAYDRLGKPDHDRFTWLKGDARFDTLRLACLAPVTRAQISTVNPATGQEHGRISSVTINDETWFTRGTVSINTGLVAIIGMRGSGKTALADLIAVGAGSTQPFRNSASFVSRAGGLLDGAESTVLWHRNEKTTHALSDKNDDIGQGEHRVRYLSQQFVERLCASDGVTDELLAEIERVIFDAWPIEDRQGSTNFRELLDIRLGALRAQQASELEAIGQISEEITNQRVLKKALSQKQRERKQFATTISTLEGKIKELTLQTGGTSGERHAVVSAALARRQNSLQGTDRRVTEIIALQAAVRGAVETQFPQFLRRLREQYPRAGLTETQWQAFLPRFSEDVEDVLDKALASTQAQRAAIAGHAVDPKAARAMDALSADILETKTVAELRVEQARLQQLVGLDRERAAKLTKLQGQLGDARTKSERLDAEMEEAKGADGRVDLLIEERTQRYQAYFNALLGQEQELQRLYAPLEDILRTFGSTVAKLKLVVRRRVDVGTWVSQGEALIDLRTAGTFRGAGEMRRIVEDSLRQVWQTGDAEEAAAAIQRFSADHSETLRNQSRALRGDERTYRNWEREVSRWLYNVDHIDVTYSLEYDGLNVERLSPGLRGIVLLLLYLAVDQAETDPLIIDQPEENLDPESIFSELVTLFQSASARRQIIMITHNANLVVNTDVDQVIVAHCGSLEEGKLPRLSYVSGGLEDPAIRRSVCDVLEGGEEAFRQRARRLHIDFPSTVSLDG